MVMTIVPFNKRGRPWSDHGQFMVILWSTMVMDYDRPWSEHGRPWSDHDPAARVNMARSKFCDSFRTPLRNPLALARATNTETGVTLFIHDIKVVTEFGKCQGSSLPPLPLRI